MCDVVVCGSSSVVVYACSLRPALRVRVARHLADVSRTLIACVTHASDLGCGCAMLRMFRREALLAHTAVG
jgi:hypothetical protein